PFESPSASSTSPTAPPPPLSPLLLPLLSTLILSCRTVTAYHGADNAPTSASTISAYTACTGYFSASGISACRTSAFRIATFSLSTSARDNKNYSLIDRLLRASIFFLQYFEKKQLTRGLRMNGLGVE
ncbi:hypothetical protein BDZ91DRAFT_750417, partial [Kalaharituber pfeilii]